MGDPKTLSLRVVIQNTKCFSEANQWVSKGVLECREKEPEVCCQVLCKAEEKPISLFNGVFLCCTGNPIFDGRFVCSIPARADKPQKNVLVVWQDKHSQISSTTSVVTAEEILTWYKNAQKVLRKWQEASWDIVYFFFDKPEAHRQEKINNSQRFTCGDKRTTSSLLGPHACWSWVNPEICIQKTLILEPRATNPNPTGFLNCQQDFNHLSDHYMLNHITFDLKYIF